MVKLKLIKHQALQREEGKCSIKLSTTVALPSAPGEGLWGSVWTQRQREKCLLVLAILTLDTNINISDIDKKSIMITASTVFVHRK
jgi:hypothetical protein